MILPPKIVTVIAVLALSLFIFDSIFTKKWLSLIYPRHLIQPKGICKFEGSDIFTKKRTTNHEWNKEDWLELYKKHEKLESPFKYRYFPPYNHNEIGFLEKKHTCDEQLETLVEVISTPCNFERRLAIRETWASVLNKTSVKVIFFLGRSKDENVSRNLDLEKSKYKDLIQGDFIDHYYNLSLKSFLMIKWATVYCPHVKNMVKVDDDVYFNANNLQQELSKVSDGMIYGDIMAHANPVTSLKSSYKKFYVDTLVYPWKTFPSYVSGPLYFMTICTGKQLYLASSSIPMFFMEDVYISGMLRDATGIKLKNVFYISTTSKVNCCCGNSVTHNNNAKLMRTKFKACKL